MIPTVPAVSSKMKASGLGSACTVPQVTGGNVRYSATTVVMAGSTQPATAVVSGHQCRGRVHATAERSNGYCREVPVGAQDVGQKCDELILVHGHNAFAMINVGPSQPISAISSKGRKPHDR